MPRQLFGLILAGLFLLVGCGEDSDSPGAVATLNPIDTRDLQIVIGQKIYVPAYSEIFYGDADKTIKLAVTLSIHNTDDEYPIIVQSVRYYDTDGTLVREYIESPIEIAPLATTGFVVEEQDTSGGWGANFVVEWGAEVPVHEPIVEAIMIGTQSSQGISLISEGRVVEELTLLPVDTPKLD